MVLRDPMETDHFACFPFLKSQHHMRIWITVSTLPKSGETPPE